MDKATGDKPMTQLLLGLCGLLLVLVLAEISLRVGFGFGRPPLYVADETIGYRLAPNQQTRRFGNLIAINEYSMRAGAIAPSPSPQTLRIFMLGDSLTNGNWWTDQAEIISAKVANYLSNRLPEGYTQVEALNASANSWGPRNELAYLERYGLFESQVLVLVLNTDDLFSAQPTSVQVGRDRNYPNSYPRTAIGELIAKKLLKSPDIPELQAIRAVDKDPVSENLRAIAAIREQAIAANTQFVLVLSPLKRELPGPRDYEILARERLKNWAKDNNVSYLDLLSDFQTAQDPEGLYRDHIHLSPRGNEWLSSLIADTVIGQ